MYNFDYFIIIRMKTKNTWHYIPLVYDIDALFRVIVSIDNMSLIYCWVNLTFSYIWCDSNICYYRLQRLPFSLEKWSVATLINTPLILFYRSMFFRCLDRISSYYRNNNFRFDIFGFFAQQKLRKSKLRKCLSQSL